MHYFNLRPYYFLLWPKLLWVYRLKTVIIKDKIYLIGLTPVPLQSLHYFLSRIIRHETKMKPNFFNCEKSLKLLERAWRVQLDGRSPPPLSPITHTRTTRIHTHIAHTHDTQTHSQTHIHTHTHTHTNISYTHRHTYSRTHTDTETETELNTDTHFHTHCYSNEV